MGRPDAPFRKTAFPSSRMRVERRADGTILATPELPLAEHDANLPRELARRAALHPDKTYLAERQGGAQGPWRLASYGEVDRLARAVAAWLLRAGIGADRSLLILSGNSIAHAVVKYGAMAAHLPACPVSTNYATMGGDYGRLRHVIGLLKPAVVFAEQTAMFKAALESVDFGDATIITDDPALIARTAGGGRVIATAEVFATPPGSEVTQAIETLDPDAPTLYMLTSGSTSLPKAVIQTQRMITANLAQGRQVLGETAGWSDVMLDWLPWNHVSGAFTKMGTLVSGGTLYIDGGRPMPGAPFEESLSNLKEVAPKFYVNVPFGYAMLADALDRDEELRKRFFGNLRLALYGGAGLPQALYDRFQQLAVDTIGERIFFTTGYGATETSSGCMAIYFPTEEVGIGLPMPGLTMKLVPNGDRYEVRLKGPMVTPGYLGQGEKNRGIFDEEGFYRTGDAAQLHDPDDLGKGLKFAGRLAEEFKLSSGTWVTAGRLRALLIEALSPLVADILVCGENRDRIALLAWPKVAVDDALRTELAKRLAAFNAGRGASERITALGLLTEPPRVDAHEVSDKGTINQRVAMTRRSADVERLYTEPPDPAVILPRGG
ncbi:MAG: AMP-binding protein [Gammaproteobacteria bacterium]